MPISFTSLSSVVLVVTARRGHPLQAGPLPPRRVIGAGWALPPAHTLARRKLEGRAISLGLPPPAPALTSASLAFLTEVALRTDLLLYTTRSLIESSPGLE